MHEFFYQRGATGLSIALLILLLGATELGFWITRRNRGRLDESASPSLVLIQGAMLTLLGLLLAFSVSMSEIRFEARKQLLVDEATSIGTTYLRASLLPEAARAPMQGLLKQYVEDRIKFYEIKFDTPMEKSVQDEADQLQQRLWHDAAEIGRKNSRDISVGLFIQSLNETIDQKERQSTAFENHVPGSITALLFLSSILVMASVGYIFGISGLRYIVSTSILSVVITMTVFVVLDLDRPRRGLIRLNDKSMIRLRESLQKFK